MGGVLDEMTGGKEKNRFFMEIASGIVVSMLIVFITIYMPLMGFFMATILPMPILYFRLKLGRNLGALIMFAVFVMTFAATYNFSGMNGGLSEITSNSLPKAGGLSLSIDILFYGSLLLTGFFLGEFLELRLSIEKSFVYTLISTLGISAAAFFVYAASTGQGVLSIVSGYVADNLQLTLALYENMGMSPENIQLISDSIHAIQYILVRIIPALVTILLSFVIWVNILFIKKILDKKAIHLTELQNLNQWKAQEHLVWVVIALGLLMVIPGKGIKIVAFNCIMILMIMYFFQGIAILAFIFERKKLPILLKIAIYSIIAIQQILILAIIGLGFFDTWVNFRKIGINNKPDEQSFDG
ncbi:MAG: DUF2232 domain-containing protein [Desulfamplus sp.]|nr:DUF2232 domain-containing protein [Desulfamplus sp.]